MKLIAGTFVALCIATGFSDGVRAESTTATTASAVRMNPGTAALPLTADGELELRGGIKWLLEKNFSLRVQALDVASASDEVVKAWGEFDPKYFASSTYEDNLRRLKRARFLKLRSDLGQSRGRIVQGG